MKSRLPILRPLLPGRAGRRFRRQPSSRHRAGWLREASWRFVAGLSPWNRILQFEARITKDREVCECMQVVVLHCDEAVDFVEANPSVGLGMGNPSSQGGCGE